MTRTILCFGDSNTHGTMGMRHPTDRRRHAFEDRWTSILARTLGTQWRVIPEGHPGRTSVFDDPIEGTHKNGLRALKANLESHRPLDLVIVMLGTNDQKAIFGVTARDISLGVQRLVKELRGSDCGPSGGAPQILVVSPVPVRETGTFAEMFAGAEDKSRKLPDALADMAKRNAVAFYDLAPIATVDPTDGVHLDQAAHLAIGQALGAQVLHLFSTPKT